MKKEDLAEWLHNVYEEVSVITSWDTQEKCQVPFKDLPVENKNAMVMLANRILTTWDLVEKKTEDDVK